MPKQTISKQTKPREIDFDKIQTDIQSAVKNMELQLKMDRDNITGQLETIERMLENQLKKAE